MNSNADDATTKTDVNESVAAPLADDAAPAPAKTVRRKRAVKAAEPAAADVGESVAPAPEASAAEEEGAKPKPARKRRTTKAAAESAEGGAESTQMAAPVDAPAPAAAPAVPQSAIAPVVAAEVAPVEQGRAVESTSSRAEAGPAAEGASVEGVEATAEGSSGDGPQDEGEQADGEQGPRSERRRRNRRERRRGRDEAGAPESQDAAAPREPGEARTEGEEDSDAPEAAPTPNLPPVDINEVFANVLSGQYDAEGGEAPEPPPPHKRVLLPEPDAPKLHKVLAQAGIGSRRDMEQLIQDGKVQVNNQIAHIGQRISFGDHIKVDGKPVKVRIIPPPPRIIAYHKPAGEVVTHDDPQHRPTVFRRLPRLRQGKWQSVGRLDLNTEGLLLFTNSGELANQLMHPRFGVEREYAVRVLGQLDEDTKADLLEGVDVDGQEASFRSIEDGGGEGANHWYRVVITEGRNREVRKLFDAVGLTVSRLIRIRYGTVVLPRGLKRGMWVDLGEDDVRAIRRLAGGGEAREGRDDREGGRGGRNRNKQRNKNDRRNNAPLQQRGNRPPEGMPQQRADAPPRDDRDFDDDDFDPSRIPDPLEQTFDKRFVKNPRTAVGGKGFRSGGGGFGTGGSGPGPKKGGGPREPDPLQTSVGYIGADAFHRKGNRGGGRGGRGGGGGGGGGFGGGGGGRRGGR